ncbi:hypothetical protein TRIUR3_33584 [Triticum urartu]|uniref:Uncharacterized protein n=1 Tax=Triticum urartu TaxID=4572 RepID=M7ZVN5_TRIUA|nr:hypothetical protein TRIUR3_33584 [Triticum urartu]
MASASSRSRRRVNDGRRIVVPGKGEIVHYSLSNPENIWRKKKVIRPFLYQSNGSLESTDPNKICRQRDSKIIEDRGGDERTAWGTTRHHDQMEALWEEMDAAVTFLRAMIQPRHEAATGGTGRRQRGEPTATYRSFGAGSRRVRTSAPSCSRTRDESDDNRFHRAASAMQARMLETLEREERETPELPRRDLTIPFTCSYME